MSVQALTAAFALRGVSPSEKLLLLAMANYANEEMKCFPSQRRLAADTGLSDRTIRTVLAELERRNLISRDHRQRPDGSRASDTITLRIQPETISGGAEAISGGGETASGGVGKPLPGGTETASGLTTFEPPAEPSEEPRKVLQLAEGEPQPKPVRGTTIPADWAPSPADWEYAAAKGLAPDRITRAAERFTNFWRAKTGASARKRDWAATWRNWILEDLDRHPPPKARPKQAVW